MGTIDWILENGVAGVAFFVAIYIYLNGSMFARKVEKELMIKITEVSDKSKENSSETKVLAERLESFERQLMDIKKAQASNADKLDELKTLLNQVKK